MPLNISLRPSSRQDVPELTPAELHLSSALLERLSRAVDRAVTAYLTKLETSQAASVVEGGGQ